MFINKKGELIENLPQGSFIPYDGLMMVQKKYRVRIIYSEERIKKVIGEEDFDEVPNDMQIMFCILAHKETHMDNSSIFATVAPIYILKDPYEGLPFN